MISSALIGAIASRSRSSSVTDPNYANVSLLLHCDGANGGTTFTDNSPTPKTVTTTSVTTSTTQAKFGSASAFISTLPNTNVNVLTTPDDAAFNFPTSDFTLECWVYMTTVETCILVQKAAGIGTYPWQLYVSTNVLGFRGFDGTGTLIYALLGTTALAANTWYFVQAVRFGNTFTVALNGVQEATVSLGATTLLTNADNVTIGNYNGGAEYPVIGFMDDIRITKGVARALALPTAAFPNS